MSHRYIVYDNEHAFASVHADSEEIAIKSACSKTTGNNPMHCNAKRVTVGSRAESSEGKHVQIGSKAEATRDVA